MNPRSAVIFGAVLLVLMFAPRFVKIVPPGHVSVSDFLGNVNEERYEASAHIVNPLLRWHDFDIRENTLEETAQVPTRDQLQTQVDVSIQWRINPQMAARLFEKVGTREQAIAVYLTPKVRSLVREQGKTIDSAEDFFREETRDRMEADLHAGLQGYPQPLGIDSSSPQPAPLMHMGDQTGLIGENN